MFEKFAVVADKIENGDGGTLEEQVAGAIDVYATYQRLLDLITARVDLKFVQQYYPEADGYHEGIDFDVTESDNPKLIVKFEANRACGCHPEYETTGYEIPVKALLEGDRGVVEFRAAKDLEKKAQEEKERAEEVAYQARLEEQRKQNELKELERLKEKYPEKV
jgi:hypothetical protein